ncbi:MAG TPA: hypothetical protein VMU13_00215 [Candidatus Paceibacterota bacterium]|nr:hypothetical protein [Candidatus Paceibacterota bacterium]
MQLSIERVRKMLRRVVECTDEQVLATEEQIGKCFPRLEFLSRIAIAELYYLLCGRKALILENDESTGMREIVLQACHDNGIILAIGLDDRPQW